MKKNQFISLTLFGLLFLFFSHYLYTQYNIIKNKKTNEKNDKFHFFSLNNIEKYSSLSSSLASSSSLFTSDLYQKQVFNNLLADGNSKEHFFENHSELNSETVVFLIRTYQGHFDSSNVFNIYKMLSSLMAQKNSNWLALLLNTDPKSLPPLSFPYSSDKRIKFLNLPVEKKYNEWVAGYDITDAALDYLRGFLFHWIVITNGDNYYEEDFLSYIPSYYYSKEVKKEREKLKIIELDEMKKYREELEEKIKKSRRNARKLIRKIKNEQEEITEETRLLIQDNEDENENEEDKMNENENENENTENEEKQEDDDDDSEEEETDNKEAYDNTDIDLILTDYWSRYKRVDYTISPADLSETLCYSAKLQPGYVDLGGVIINLRRFQAEKRRFMDFGPINSQDGFMFLELSRGNWKSLHIPKCLFSHSPNPYSCHKLGGLWFDSASSREELSSSCWKKDEIYNKLMEYKELIKIESLSKIPILRYFSSKHLESKIKYQKDQINFSKQYGKILQAIRKDYCTNLIDVHKNNKLLLKNKKLKKNNKKFIFSPEIYQSLHPDLKDMNKQELEDHFFTYGCLELRSLGENTPDDYYRVKKNAKDNFREFDFNMILN